MIGTKDNSNDHTKDNFEDKTAGTLKTIFHSLGSRPTSASFRKLAALGSKMMTIMIDCDSCVNVILKSAHNGQSAFDKRKLCKTNSS